MKQRTYIAIDLKSFYASVECRERNLDPLDTNLVVADESRTDKTICLAVTPSLKSYGISGRGRLFEVKQRVKEANAGRQHDAPGHRLDGTSHFLPTSSPMSGRLAENLYQQSAQSKRSMILSGESPCGTVRRFRWMMCCLLRESYSQCLSNIENGLKKTLLSVFFFFGYLTFLLYLSV